MCFKFPSGSVCLSRKAKQIVRTAEETRSALSTLCTISTPISTVCTATIKNSTAISSVENIMSVEGTRISFQSEWPKFNWRDLIVSIRNLYRSQIDLFYQYWNSSETSFRRRWFLSSLFSLNYLSWVVSALVMLLQTFEIYLMQETPFVFFADCGYEALFATAIFIHFLCVACLISNLLLVM